MNMKHKRQPEAYSGILKEESENYFCTPAPFCKPPFATPLSFDQKSYAFRNKNDKNRFTWKGGLFG